MAHGFSIEQARDKKKTAVNNKKRKRGRIFFSLMTSISEVDHIMLLTVLLLSLFGSFMIFSASTAYAEIRFGDAYYFVRRQALWCALGILAMLLFSMIPLNKIKPYVPHMYGITLFLLLLVPLFGTEAGGAKRWIAIGPLTFQPSELAKTLLVMILAYYFSSDKVRARIWQGRKSSFLHGILYPLSFLLLLCGFILPEKHLSCIIILGVLCIALIFLAGGNGKILGIMCGSGALAVTAFALAVDYTRRRITIWLNPELYPRDGGWQTLQGLMAIGSGGLFGLGYGNSRLKYLYVSEPQNDFIFTILCEELGFFGAFLALSLFAVFVYRGTAIAARHPDIFSSLVVMGLTLKVAIQVLLNICVITNTLPNTGISLPFFSYGGSSLVMLFAEMGLILSASKSSHIPR